MLGTQVASDLELANLQISCKTSWGHTAFQAGLTNVTSDRNEIKQRQLPLLALRRNAALCNKICGALTPLPALTPKVDEAMKSSDELEAESIRQILWAPESYTAFLNTQGTFLNAVATWKTLLVPAFAVLMPILTIVVPYFLLRFLHKDMSVSMYMGHLRRILLQQITMPALLRARGENDIVGYTLETAFLLFTVGMFLSGIWNQISAALHLRTIWDLLEGRGGAVLQTIELGRRVLDAGAAGARGGLRDLLAEGATIVGDCERLLGGRGGVAAFGAVWNGGAAAGAVGRLRDWLGRVDVLCTLAGLGDAICVPRLARGVTAPLRIRGVYHPRIVDCVPNDYGAAADGAHVLLTGPNRGGKSTYCKAVGLAIITAQSWGFAWARAMTWSPFGAVLTALESNGQLGFNSTFEAEIEFAKSVLERQERPLYVMMDEIFHSTNAIDGVAASKVFLDRLYVRPGVQSLLSTHYRELAETYSKNGLARTQQMVASEGADGVLAYAYTVADGVSDKSSVMEILREKGLLCAAAESA
jgi:hypothetical protein